MGYANTLDNCRTDFSLGQKAWMLVWAFRFKDAVQNGWLPSSNDRFDTFEPDNAAVAARPIVPGETQEHTFHRKNQDRVDVDWVSFTASACSLVEPTTFRVTEVSNNPIDEVVFFTRNDTTNVEDVQLTVTESNGLFTIPAGTLTPNNDYLIRITQDNDNSEYKIESVAENQCINGPDYVCSSNSIFSIPSRPAGSTLIWKHSRNMTYIAGQGTNSYTVRSGIGSGNGWVSLDITIGGVTYSLPQKQTWVGTPNQVSGGMSYDLMLGVPNEICVENMSAAGDFYAGLIRSYADYAEWQTDAGAIISLDPTPEFYNQISVRLNNHGQNRYIRTREVNACGAGPWLTSYFDLVYPVNGCSGSGGGFGRIAMFPNPASDELYFEEISMAINSSESNTLRPTEEKEQSITVKIMNSAQKIVHEETCNDKKLVMDVSVLKPGTYYVKIIYMDEVSIERLIVE